jgi:hypothetical protein
MGWREGTATAHRSCERCLAGGTRANTSKDGANFRFDWHFNELRMKRSADWRPPTPRPSHPSDSLGGLRA